MNEPVRVTVRVVCDGANAGCTLLTDATASTKICYTIQNHSDRTTHDASKPTNGCRKQARTVTHADQKVQTKRRGHEPKQVDSAEAGGVAPNLRLRRSPVHTCGDGIDAYWENVRTGEAWKVAKEILDGKPVTTQNSRSTTPKRSPNNSTTKAYPTAHA